MMDLEQLSSILYRKNVEGILARKGYRNLYLFHRAFGATSHHDLRPLMRTYYVAINGEDIARPAFAETILSMLEQA